MTSEIEPGPQDAFQKIESFNNEDVTFACRLLRGLFFKKKGDGIVEDPEVLRAHTILHQPSSSL